MVSVEASDGLTLNGFTVTPEGEPRAAVVWLHGFGVGYDLPECVRLGQEVAGRGLTFVAGNLRGHDGGAVGFRRTANGQDTFRVGSWWEIFEETERDVSAWVRFARSLGSTTVVLAGHSFGGLKAVFYISSTRAADVAGLALVSPSLGLTHLDAAVADTATALVADGHGETLLPAGSWARGFGTDTVSAQTYASWWRVAPGFFGEGRTRFADIACPLLVVYGATGDLGGRKELDYFARLATSTPSFDSVIVPGLRHRYAGAEGQLADVLDDWILRVLGQAARQE